MFNKNKNNSMNQIICKINNKKNKLIIFFYIQFLISLIILLSLIFNIRLINNYDNEYKEISNQIRTNSNLNNLYNQYQTKFLGNLIISKINIEYPIYNEYTEENLKISICKYRGKNLEENGNITIIGHNYKDNRFFGRLNEIEENDKILIQNNNKKYNYKVIKKYMVDYKDFSCLEPVVLNNKELTLITCDNIAKKKRLVIKAIFNQNE